MIFHSSNKICCVNTHRLVPPLGTHMQGSRLNFYTGVPNLSIYLPSCSPFSGSNEHIVKVLISTYSIGVQMQCLVHPWKQFGFVSISQLITYDYTGNNKYLIIKYHNILYYVSLGRVSLRVCFHSAHLSYFHRSLCVYMNTEDFCHGVDWFSIAPEL